MATSPRTLGEDLKAWAQAQLLVDPGAAPEAVRAAFLRQVQHDNGNPNLSAREALLVLTGRTNAARPALALEAAEESLQRAVDDFANRFFALPIAERQSEWDRLKARGQGFARVDARLTALRPGIDVVMPRVPDDRSLDEVIEAVRTLFVLRPAARAAARQACLHEAEHNGQWPAWVRAAQRLCTQHKAIASLEPELIARLAGGPRRSDQKARLNRAMRKAARTAAPAQAGTASSSNSRWLALLVVLGGLSCVRLLGTSMFSSKPVPPPLPQQPEFHFDLKDLEKFRKEFRKDRVQIDDKQAEDIRNGQEGLRRLLGQPDIAKDKKDRP